MDRSLDQLRRLDIDDMILMRLLLMDYNGVEVAKELGLTQPAISHRKNKLSDIFGGFFNHKVKGTGRECLTEKGLEICKKMDEALKVLVS